MPGGQPQDGRRIGQIALLSVGVLLLIYAIFPCAFLWLLASLHVPRGTLQAIMLPIGLLADHCPPYERWCDWQFHLLFGSGP